MWREVDIRQNIEYKKSKPKIDVNGREALWILKISICSWWLNASKAWQSKNIEPANARENKEKNKWLVERRLYKYKIKCRNPKETANVVNIN